MQKCEPQERSPCAPKFEDGTQEETLQQERCMKFGENTYKLKNADQAAFYH